MTDAKADLLSSRTKGGQEAKEVSRVWTYDGRGWGGAGAKRTQSQEKGEGSRKIQGYRGKT